MFLNDFCEARRAAAARTPSFFSGTLSFPLLSSPCRRSPRKPVRRALLGARASPPSLSTLTLFLIPRCVLRFAKPFYPQLLLFDNSGIMVKRVHSDTRAALRTPAMGLRAENQI